MEPTLGDKVEDWLNREGYPLEFRAARAFREAGFQVTQGDHVKDLETGKLREIDVLAEHLFATRHHLLRIAHVVECKFASKPWVVFRDPGAAAKQSVGWSNLFASSTLLPTIWTLGQRHELSRFRAFAVDEGGLGFGGCAARIKSPADESGTGKGGGGRAGGDGDGSVDQLYSAVQAAVARCAAYEQLFNASGPRADWHLPLHGTVAFPMVVLRGKLFSAEYHEEQDRIFVTERSLVQLAWSGSPNAPSFVPVTIIAEEALPDYAKALGSELPALERELRRVTDLVDEAVESRSLDPLELPPVYELPPGILSRLDALDREVEREESE